MLDYMAAMSDMAYVVNRVVNAITHYPILYCMFAGGLLGIAAKVFKRIKNATK